MRESFVVEAGDPALARLPEIRMFGDARHRRAEQRLAPHRNSGVEICLCRAGIYRWQVGGTIVEIKPGEVSVTRPWEIHSGVNNVLGPGRLTWIILSATGRSELRSNALARLLGTDARSILSAIAETSDHHLGVVGQVEAAFDRLEAELSQERPGRLTSMRATVALLLVEVARRLSERQTTSRPSESAQQEIVPHVQVPDSVQRVIERVAAQPEAEWTSREMAREAGLGITAFTVWCRRVTGRSPRWYLLEQRLRSAQRQLRESDRSITEVALESGFSSSQHFSTTFRTFFGETPSEYRIRTSARGE